MMVLLWGAGAYGHLVLERSSHPARVVSDRHDQARRPRFHDQRNRDDRARGGGRRRRPGGRPDPELRHRPARPEQADQLRLAGRAGDRAGPARRALFQARLDQARGRVAKAEADIEQAQAKLRQAERELERCRKLQARGTAVIAAQEYDAALTNYESAKADAGRQPSALAVARADLEEATVNLGYTTIRSPVKGIILDRRINIGQTVVASLNAPSLFLIAKDLSRLEIWSSVNETDIGSIHVGQEVHFTVSSLPRETFEGKVSQIRLNASMTQNVVTYTVVVAVDNSSGRLLPYLTARLQFEVEARKGVLLVPNAALRWQPHVQNVVPEAREDYALVLRRSAARARRVRAGRSTPPATSRQVSSGSGRAISCGRSRSASASPTASSPRSPADGLAEGTEIVVGANRIDPTPTPCRSCRIPGASREES